MTEEEATQRRKQEVYQRSIPPGEGYVWNHGKASWSLPPPQGFYYDPETGDLRAIPTQESLAIERERERAKAEKAARDRGERPTEQELRNKRGGRQR